MANTITNKTLIDGPSKRVVYLNIVYVDGQETDYVVYDSSSFSSTSDSSDSTILSIKGIVSAASTARVFLEWKATTDVLALAIPIGTEIDLDFKCFGGLPNQGAAGKNGDIVLTTTGLAAGDVLTLVLEVKPN